MDALVNDPRVSFDEIIRSTGLSPKTVRKHLAHLLETKTISVTPLLGALTDSADLIYPLIVTGRTSIIDIRRIMGEAALVHHTQDPPMKYMLCKESSLTYAITKTRELEKVQGVESVTISLNREMLVSTELRYTLIQEGIRKLKRIK
jgi:Winged helix-turn-helix DNA-binding